MDKGLEMGILVLVRHGQASFLSDDYDRLSPLGERQAHLLGEYLVRHEISFDEVYVGPLQRQQHTAGIVRKVVIGAGRPWPEPQVLEELVEFPAERLALEYFPRLMAEDERVREWMTAFEASHDVAEKARLFQKAFELLMAKWARNELGSHDEIEPWSAFESRVEGALKAMTDGKGSGRRIAAFTSGGVTATAVRHALDLSPERTMQLAWMLRNGAFTEFLFTQGRFTLSSFNDVPHLPDPELWTFR